MVEKELPLASNIAVSIEYEGTSAPKVTAKGKGYLAQEIIQTAKEFGIPIQENGPLVELLSQVELDQEIPPELYEAVVQVLIFAYQISGKEITPMRPELQP
jgi:flagellar biosynthesis protein